MTNFNMGAERQPSIPLTPAIQRFLETHWDDPNSSIREMAELLDLNPETVRRFGKLLQLGPRPDRRRLFPDQRDRIDLP